MPDAVPAPDITELQARVRRLEDVVGVLVDVLEKVAPHLPVLVSMEASALADEARSLLQPESIDLTGPGE